MPVAAKHMERAFKHHPRILKNLPRLVDIFCGVFRENSKSIRAKFFENELVQHMWTRYIDAESGFISKYLSDLINVEARQSEACILLKDMLIIGNRINFNIIKPELLQLDKK